MEPPVDEVEEYPPPRPSPPLLVALLPPNIELKDTVTSPPAVMVIEPPVEEVVEPPPRQAEPSVISGAATDRHRVKGYRDSTPRSNGDSPPCGGGGESSPQAYSCVISAAD